MTSILSLLKEDFLNLLKNEDGKVCIFFMRLESIRNLGIVLNLLYVEYFKDGLRVEKPSFIFYN